MRGLQTLPEALCQAAGSGAGVTFCDRGEETFRSYADLLTSARRVAASLAAAGLRRRDLVAVVVSDAEPFLTTLFGASLLGIVPALIYPPLTTVDLPQYLESSARVLRAAGARALVADTALVAAFESLRPVVPTLDLVLARETLDAAPIETLAPVALDDVAFVQFTSGSTSLPKGVTLSHANLCANILAVGGPNGLHAGAGDVAVSWLPLYHDMGLVGMLLGALYAVSPAVLVPPHTFVRRPAEWLRAITKYRGTISFAPTFAYDLCVRRLKARDLDGLDLSSWRVAGCGAEPIHAPTLQAFAEKFAPVGFRASSLLASYGLAEHVVAATLSPVGRGLATARVGEDDLVGCGRPLADHQLRIADESGAPLPDGTIGEIVLAGPSVMLGYYNEDTLTRQTVRDGWLRTGDLGCLKDGELFVCGRAKDVIIANGRKFHPQDLEWALEALDGLRRGKIVVFGVAQPGRADRVVVLVEAKPSDSTPALTAAIRSRVGDWFGIYVDDVAYVPSGTITRTTSGKVQRHAARARYLETENVEVRARS